MRKIFYQDQDLTHQIIAAAIEVHKNLGPGAALRGLFFLCDSAPLHFTLR